MEDNSCVISDFDGGQIDLKYRVDKTALFLDYSYDGTSFNPCINGKRYAGFATKGYVGISSGNPTSQNVNEIDVHKIDFYNMNAEYY
jgi:hypothetical protein